MKSKYYKCMQLLAVSLGLTMLLWFGSLAGEPEIVLAQDAGTSVYAQSYCNNPGVICKSGFISSNETWTSANVYVIIGTTFFRDTLTIEPGTIIKMAQNTTLYVAGKDTLTAQGTAANKIVVTAVEDDTVGGDTNGDGSLTTPTKNDRRSVRFVNSSQGSLAHTEIRYTGVAVSNSAQVTIIDTILQNNKTALGTGNGVTVTVSNTIIQDNDVAITAVAGASVTLAGTIIRRNETGLTTSSGATITVSGCSQIVEQTQFAVRNTNGTVNAPLVWWGSTNGPNVTDVDGGNYVSGNVAYAPWASSQNCSTMPSGDRKISGLVIDNDDTPVAGVTLRTGTGQSSTTGSDGRYTITELAEGEYTVTPSLSGYQFTPPIRTVFVGAGDVSNVDFVGSSEARLEVNPDVLRFLAIEGSDLISQFFTIQNVASEALLWQAQEDMPWLSLDQTSGSTPSLVEAQVDVSGLQVGRYTGQITVTSNSAINSPLALDVTLNLGCNVRGDTDIMLIMDTSGSMQGQPLVDAKEAALAFLDQIDLSRNQVGLVSFNARATLESQLSQNDTAIRTVIAGLSADGSTDIAEAVQVAYNELKSDRANSTHQPIIILLSDGEHTDAGNPIAEAQMAKDDGIQIITIGLGQAEANTLQAMASSSSDYYYTPNSDELETIYEQISVTVGCSTLTVAPTSLEYNYTLGDPAPAQTVEVGSLGGVVNWTATEIPDWLSFDTRSGQTPQTLTAQLEPDNLAIGHYEEEIVFTSPEATNSPVVVDVALNVSCRQRSAVDVALVVDVSGSMAGGALDEAKIAAKSFVDAMDLRTDQVTLVEFSGFARVVQPLTQDANTVKAKIDNLYIKSATNLSSALQKARSELNSDRHNPNNQPVIVLLADGLPNAGGNPVPIANAAKSEGIYIFTVGLRGDYGLDGDLLRAIASTPTDYYETPDASELVEIYSGIAAQVGCPTLEIKPQTLHFDLNNGATIGTLPLTIDNRQDSPINWTVSEDIPWLTVTQSSGSTPSTFTVKVDATGLTSGLYEDTLSFVSPVALNSPQAVPVSLNYQESQNDDPSTDHTIYLPLITK